MKYGLITNIAFFAAVTLTGCTATSTSKFAEVEKGTSDFCSKFNGVNKMGKEIKVTNYTIKVKEMDSAGNKIENNKTVTCDA